MNRILILFIGCVAFMSVKGAVARKILPAPAVVIKPPPDLTKECAEDFKIYHECSDEKRLVEDQFREERRQNLTKIILQVCFAENKCTPPAVPPLQAETPEQQACHNAYRAAKRAEIRKCVNKAYPSYVFGKDIDRSHVGDDHLLRLLGLTAEHCEDKRAVLTCALAQVEEFRKTRYQLNCGIKESCRVLMSEKCQDHHLKIKYSKCECKKQVKQSAPALRASIPACRLVPPKPQRPAHGCPINGFCRAGYKEWLKQHPPPTLTQVSAALPPVQAVAAPAIAAAKVAAVAGAVSAKECAEEFKLYHECSGEKRLAEDQFREERRQNLTKIIVQVCFAENKCTPPAVPPLEAETSEQQACHNAYRAAKRAEILKCVNKAYPSYVFGNEIDRSHVGDDHLLRLLKLNAEHCEDKRAVLTCALAQIEDFRKTRYQLNCGIKESCRVLMSEKCQDHHLKIKYSKCECKKQVKEIAPALRASIAACRLVPPKPQRPAHDCPINGFCRAGYKEWLKRHPPPTLTQVSPALPPVQAAAAPAEVAAVAGTVQAKECAEDFKLYHECSGEKNLVEDQFREERRQNLTKIILQVCFAKNECTPPAVPPLQPETPEQQACYKAYRAAKRAEIRKCVNKAYPSYIFGNEIDRSHVGDDHLLRLLGLSAEHCEDKRAVLTCALAQVEDFRKTRYQLNCGIKESCRVLMSEKCQDHHLKIKYSKCECKKQMKQIAPALRASIAACRLVPPKPPRPAHDCPINGFCRAGYKEWLKQHPPPPPKPLEPVQKPK